MELSKAQQKAAYHKDGAALVLAGPGSGKTTVITERLNFLTSGITEPSRLLSVTFSRAAGREMAIRYQGLYPGRELPVFGTVHSLCNRIIMDHENITGVRLTRIEGDPNIKLSILKTIWDNVNPGFNMPDTEEMISLISRKTNRPDSLADFDKIRNFDLIFDQYRAYKREKGLIDFDDMVFYARELLESNKAIKERWAYKYEYIQVDEGQDLSKSQFEVIRYLAGYGNVFVVADDDQGIYAFRGADPSCVLEFEKYYSGCVKYYLEQNYRSCKRIVECASTVVGRNRNRYEKNLFTENTLGEKIRFIHAKDLNSQAGYICEKIKKLRKKGTVAILYRNSISSLMFKLYLNYYGIQCNVLGGNFIIEYDYIVKYLLKSISNAEKGKGFIIPHPKSVFKGLAEKGFLEKAAEYYEKKGRIYFEYVCEFLYTLCTLYDSCEKIKECIDNLAHTGEHCDVTLTTIHSSKGLEFDTVFIVDLLNDEFPSREYLQGDLLEEERRLFYVAMTRAKKRLILSYPETRGSNHEEASIFYEECISASNK